jgi:RNA polymerase sigma-70 factor (ECF subfamily)
MLTYAAAAAPLDVLLSPARRRLQSAPRRETMMPARQRQPGRGRFIPTRRPAERLPVLSTGWPLAKDPDQARAAADLAEVRAIAAGDESAFAALIEREGPRLLRFAYGVLGSLEEAEDTVQDTFISLWENAARWRPEARLGTWLHTVCYNRAVDRLRRRRNFVAESALDDLADEADLAEGRLVRDEAVASVRNAVERLPHRQRAAIMLFHFQDMPQKQAAEVLGVSESAFESLLARARRQMRHWLTGDHDE